MLGCVAVSESTESISLNSIKFRPASQVQASESTNQHDIKMRALLLAWGLGLAASQSVATTYSVVNVGFSGYRFNGVANTNPTLYLQKGKTYTFSVNAPGHPFRIIGDVTVAFPPAQPSYNTFNDCVSCVTGENTASGNVTFAVPANPTTSNVGYRCTLHSASKSLDGKTACTTCNHSPVPCAVVGRIVFVDPPDPFSVVNVGFSGYKFNGRSTNPTLVLQRGLSYTFVVAAPGHPFRIIGDTTVAFPPSQPSYNTMSDCLSCVRGADTASGNVTFSVPVNPTSANVGYRCTLHSASESRGARGVCGTPLLTARACRLCSGGAHHAPGPPPDCEQHADLHPLRDALPDAQPGPLADPVSVAIGHSLFVRVPHADAGVVAVALGIADAHLLAERLHVAVFNAGNACTECTGKRWSIVTLLCVVACRR